jgi:ADP-ribose pyrophosphatase YjhB (NUDIX family)
MGINEEEYRFCPLCGKVIEKPGQENLESISFFCPHCGFKHYSDPKVVVSGILEIKQRILLVKRANHPQKGTWVLPGGYVDRGEELKAATAREIYEECGIKIKVKDLIGIYSYPGNPVVLVVYEAEYLSGELNINDESLEVRWFGFEELPWENIGFQSTKDTIKDYIDMRKLERRHS